MRSNELARFIGFEVVNEFNEIIGVVVGFTSNGLGEVTSVLVKSASEIYEVSIERFERVEGNKFKLISNIFYRYKVLESKIKYIYSRIENISKISEENINKNILNDIKNRAENAFRGLQEELATLKNEIRSRIEYLSGMEDKLEEAVIELKLAYLDGSIDKVGFDSRLGSVLYAKDRLLRELKMLKELLTSIESLNKESIVEVRVIS